jgi:hypothetical protein
MNYNEMLSITRQFETMGLFYDTGKRDNGKVFRFRVPSPEQLEELYHYFRSEPAAYEVLALAARAAGLDPDETSATISRLRSLSD